MPSPRHKRPQKQSEGTDASLVRDNPSVPHPRSSSPPQQHRHQHARQHVSHRRKSSVTAVPAGTSASPNNRSPQPGTRGSLAAANASSNTGVNIVGTATAADLAASESQSSHSQDSTRPSVSEPPESNSPSPSLASVSSEPIFPPNNSNSNNNNNNDNQSDHCTPIRTDPSPTDDAHSQAHLRSFQRRHNASPDLRSTSSRDETMHRRHRRSRTDIHRHPRRSHRRTMHHDERDPGAASASESSQSITTATTATTTTTTTTTNRDPLHPPDLPPSLAADVASSEEESVAELGDVSEGECSSIDGEHISAMQQQDAQISKKFSSGVVAVAKCLSSPKGGFEPQLSIGSPASASTTADIPADSTLSSSRSSEKHKTPSSPSNPPTPPSTSSLSLPVSTVKVARFSEPADDSESPIDRPVSRSLRRSHSKLKGKAGASALKRYHAKANRKPHPTFMQHSYAFAPDSKQQQPESQSDQIHPQRSSPNTPPASAVATRRGSSAESAASSNATPKQLNAFQRRRQPAKTEPGPKAPPKKLQQHQSSASPATPVQNKSQQQPQQMERGKQQQDSDTLDHLPTSLPKFDEPRTCMWTSWHAANSPSEDRSSSLVNVLLQPLPPNFDSETQLPPLDQEYTSLVRLSLWSVIDGHGGGCVATYASEVLLPHIAASVSRSLGCAIVDRGVCEVNGQLRDANALDLDGLIKSSGRSSTHSNSIHYRSPYEASDSDDDGEPDNGGRLPSVRDDDATTVNDSADNKSRSSTPAASVASSRTRQSPVGASASSSANASMSSVKTSVKTAASAAPRDAPVGTHSPGEVAAITQAITESFLAVDEGWINSIDPVATHQTSCQSNGRWNSGACALVVFTVQRLEWTSIYEDGLEHALRSPESCRGHDTSQNKDAARRRMLDNATRAKSASSLSTISSTSSLTTAEDRVHASGLESEITETEGEDDDYSMEDHKYRRRNPSRRSARGSGLPKESLITAPGSCSCHCYRAYDAMLYTAHVGDCRAVMLGSAPPRTIKVHGAADSHTDATDDESSHHSSDETECLSSSDHDANSSDDDEVDIDRKRPGLAGKAPPASSYMTYVRRPTRRQRRRPGDDFGTNAPFIALPPLEGSQSVAFEIDSDMDSKDRRRVESQAGSEPSDSSQSSQDSRSIIELPPVTRPIDLTTDHSAYNPAEVTAVLRRCNNAPRAISAGVGGGIKRVAGSLAVTRALGDAYLKTPLLSFNPYKRHAPYITARPEVNCRPVVKNGDKVLILATDGVWERATGEDVLRWVRNYYAERIAEVERRKNRRLNVSVGQIDRHPSECSDDAKHNDDDSEERPEMDSATKGGNSVVNSSGINGNANINRKRDHPQSSSPPSKRRKREGLPNSGMSSRSTVADVIVRRVLNKVRRAKNISSLHALMSLPPGRARRSKHDDITACVVDLSAFVS